MCAQVELFRGAAAAAGIDPSRYEAFAFDAADRSEANPLKGAPRQQAQL